MSGSPSPSVGSSGWTADVMQRAQTIDSRLSVLAFDDFTNDALSQILVSGDGTVTFDLPLDGGVANMQTGIFGDAQVQNAGGNIVVSDPTTKSWFVHARSQVVVEGGTGTGIYFVGLGNGPDFVALGLNTNFSTTRVYLLKQIGVGPPLAEPTDAEVEYVPVGTPDGFHAFGMGFNVDTGIITVIYDGRVALETSDLTSLPSSPCRAFSFLSNGGELANRQLLIDRIASVTESA